MDTTTSTNPQPVWRWCFVSEALDDGLHLQPRTASVAERTKRLASLSRGETVSRTSTFAPGPDKVPALCRLQTLTWKEELLGAFLTFLVPGLALTFPVVGIALLVAGFWIGFKWLGLFFATLIALAFLLPSKFQPSLLYSNYAHVLMKYFSMKVVWANSLDPTKQYILAGSPHGAFPFGNCLTFFSTAICAGFTFRGLAASAALRIPVFGHLMKTIGAVDASASCARKHLAAGESLGLNPGGIAEMFYSSSADSSTVTLVLTPRKGFIKLGLQSGAAVVPGFCFGSLEALSVGTDPFGICRRLSRALRASLVLIWGRFMLPIAHRAPVAVVMGEPIHVKKTPEPTQAQIDEVHAEFCDRMRQVFDLHKAAYGYGDKELIIV